jgi:hypothetical protein
MMPVEVHFLPLRAVEARARIWRMFLPWEFAPARARFGDRLTDSMSNLTWYQEQLCGVKKSVAPLELRTPELSRASGVCELRPIIYFGRLLRLSIGAVANTTIKDHAAVTITLLRLSRSAAIREGLA